MMKGLEGLTEAGLKQWIETSLADNNHVLAAGYQGQTLKYADEHQQLVIKVPHGRGLVKRFHIRMLKHEYQVYQKLDGLPAVPACFGLVDQKYLVLGFVEGQPIRNGHPEQEQSYFTQMFEAIQSMHARGVAHFDLKRKDNLMVAVGDRPCLIDFGAAVIYKPGFHPFNHIWYRIAKRFDYNAWIKHKYQNQFDLISEQDQPYYRKTLLEIVSRKIKRFYKDYIYDKKKKRLK